MTLKFDLLSTLLAICIAQGMFVLSVLFIKKQKEWRNFVLFGLVFSLIWLETEFLSVRQGLYIPFNLFYGTRYGAWLLIGPLIYIYSSLRKDKYEFSKLVPHFVPFLITCLLTPLLTESDLSEIQVNYGMLAAFYGFRKLSILHYAYSTIFVLQFIHLAVYLILSFFEVRKYENSIKISYSSVKINDFRWLYVLISSFVFALIGCSGFLSYTFITHQYLRALDYIYVIPLGLVSYLVSYRLAGVHWLQPSVLQDAKYEKSGLKKEEASEYHQKLLSFMSEKKPYLDNELRLRTLAEKLKISENYLSQVINEKEKLSFFDFINKYRVDEAKRLIGSSDNISLKEIGYQSGFNNRTSFTNAFKKFGGITPTKYLKREESLKLKIWKSGKSV